MINSLQLPVLTLPCVWDGSKMPRKNDALSAATFVIEGKSVSDTNIHLARCERFGDHPSTSSRSTILRSAVNRSPYKVGGEIQSPHFEGLILHLARLVLKRGPARLELYPLV